MIVLMEMYQPYAGGICAESSADDMALMLSNGRFGGQQSIDSRHGRFVMQLPQLNRNCPFAKAGVVDSALV
jgi:hypothetical protein